jgi:hypothetical protein
VRALALPASVRSRFPAYDDAAMGDAESLPWLALRLLEEGNGEELRWLLGALGRERLAALVATRGGRQLSHRSRAFWTRLLGVAASPPHPLGRELWPLA